MYYTVRFKLMVTETDSCRYLILLTETEKNKYEMETQKLTTETEKIFHF